MVFPLKPPLSHGFPIIDDLPIKHRWGETKRGFGKKVAIFEDPVLKISPPLIQESQVAFPPLETMV